MEPYIPIPPMGEVEKEFKTALAELCKKYDAEIKIVNIGKGYSVDNVIKVECGRIAHDDYVIQEYTEFDLDVAFSYESL